MAKRKWERGQLRLRKDHRWQSRPGYSVFVLGRGAIRFEIPRHWVVKPDEDSIKLHDKEPPDDDTCMAVSFHVLPPLDLSGISMTQMVEIAFANDSRPIYERGPIHEEMRNNVELGWQELRFIDPVEQRDARSRVCLARSGQIQAIITYEFWADDAERALKPWEVALSSIWMNEVIDDPSLGPKPRLPL